MRIIYQFKKINEADLRKAAELLDGGFKMRLFLQNDRRGSVTKERIRYQLTYHSFEMENAAFLANKFGGKFNASEFKGKMYFFFNAQAGRVPQIMEVVMPYMQNEYYKSLGKEVLDMWNFMMRCGNDPVKIAVYKKDAMDRFYWLKKKRQIWGQAMRMSETKAKAK